MPCSAAPNQREWDARECTWNAVRTRPARIPALLWPGDDVSIGDALRGRLALPDPEPFVDVMSRALYGDVYGAG